MSKPPANEIQATSSIDLETDEAVQQILRGSDFLGVTTITVSPRSVMGDMGEPFG